MERRETACEENVRFPPGLRNRTPRQLQCLDQFHGSLSATFLLNDSLCQHDKPSTFHYSSLRVSCSRSNYKALPVRRALLPVPNVE